MSSFLIKDFDKVMLERWRFFFHDTFWVNLEADTDKEVRNQLAILKPELVQTDRSIYPYLALRRVGVPLAKPQSPNWAMNQTGYRLHDDEVKLAMTQFKCTYQLDLYSADRELFDEFIIELQENFLRQGFLEIDTGDRFLGRHSYTIDLEEVLDNTDIESFNESVPLYRGTFIYSIMCIVPRRFKHLRMENPIIHYVEHGDTYERETIVSHHKVT